LVPIVAALLYLNTLNHQFALDDYSVIHTHSHVQNGIDGIGEILTTNYRHGNSGFNDGLYRPLSLVSFALEKEFFEMNSSLSHFINILFYALGGLFLFLALKRIFVQYPIIIPLSISLLFLAHPIHTEVVANVKGRDELFAFFGFTLCLWSFSKQLNVKSVSYLILGTLAYVFALFSKESAVTYAFMIPLLLLIHPEVKHKKVATFLLILLPLAFGFMLWRNHIINSMPNAVDAGNFSLLNNPIAATSDNSLRWGSAFALQFTFLKSLLFPTELIHDYSYNQLPLVSLFSWKSIVGIIIFLTLVGASIWGIAKKNFWGICAALYLLSVGVASQILMPIGVQFAERLLFLAALPFCMALVFLIYKLITKSKAYFPIKDQKKLVLISLAIFLLYGAKTISRNQDWENNLTLYQADVDKASHSARANYNYGSELQTQAQAVSNPQQKQQILSQSETYLKKAIQIYPDYLDAYNNLGTVLKNQTKYGEAIQVYRKNIELDPNYSKNYYNLAVVFFEAKKYSKCIEYMQQYVQLKPNSSQAYFIMAQAAEANQVFNQAIAFAQQCLQINPNQLNVLNFLGTQQGKSGQNQQAVNTFQKALQLDPQRPDIWMNLAFCYHNLGNLEKEIESLENILKIQPQNQTAIQRLQQLKSQ
jgi:tetratricopeptide (TPR) repeat protein